MKHKFLSILTLAVCLLYLSCESENIEDKYYSDGNPDNPIDTVDQDNLSEIVWLPLNGNLKDTTGRNTPLILVGEPQFVDGINPEHGKGLYLDGSSYLLINLGFYDTLSLVFWIKGEGELESPNTPVLFDYGLNALTAQLDATTGATSLTVSKNEEALKSYENPAVEYLNSFNRYSFMYVEAGGDKIRVYFKGYAASGDEVVYVDKHNLSGIIDAESDILFIGRSSSKENQSSTFFKGAIDEVHIFNKTLTDAEVENFALIPTN